jgi:hypothetical protein
VAFQIRFGVIAILSRNDRRYPDRRVLELPVAPLAARNERETRFPKVFEEVADFPWHRENLPILGMGATSNPTRGSTGSKLLAGAVARIGEELDEFHCKANDQKAGKGASEEKERRATRYRLAPVS